MYKLTRYVMFQLLSIFLVALCAMTLLMIVVAILREARQQQLDLGLVLRLVPYILPDALRFAVPATILFASCFVFGRLAASNEIVALKAMGISPWRILWPCFAAVTLLSFATVWLNDLAVSWGRSGIRRIVIASIEEIAYGMLTSHGTYTAPGFSINVKRVEGQRLVQPTVTFQKDGNAPAVVIRAEWAELRADPVADTLTIILHNGSAVGSGVEASFPGTISRVLPLSRDKDRHQQRPSQMALRDIPQAIEDQRARIEREEETLAARAAFQLAIGDLQGLTDRGWKQSELRLERQREQMFRLKTEPHRRWAAGFSCLCFVAVGAPLAIRRRFGEFWTTFFLCFLPILIVYYPLLMISIDRAKTGALPPVVVWSGNLALLVWSGWLLRRVLRY
ncbi:MAG: LptF/LptG family permease [Planctomycetales bacterium]|nr:LptF/LptG family permease [Planctomycetales bacterium]